MKLLAFLNRCKESLAAKQAAASGVFVAIIYFDGEGSVTKWERSAREWKFEAHVGGLRIPLADDDGLLMPWPAENEILGTAQFMGDAAARAWVVEKLHGLDHSKIVGEVRPA